MEEIFTDEMVEKAKRDPMLEEFTFCEDCMEHITEFIIYIRQLENAQVVAKDALETINRANAKLTKDVEYLQKELEKTREALEGKEREFVKERMKNIDDQYQRFLNKGKI